MLQLSRDEATKVKAIEDAKKAGIAVDPEAQAILEVREGDVSLDDLLATLRGWKMLNYWSLGGQESLKHKYENFM